MNTKTTARAEQLDMLAQLDTAAASASTATMPKRQPGQSAAHLKAERARHVEAAGFVTLRTARGIYRVRNTAERLAEVARKMRAPGAFGPGRKMRARHDGSTARPATQQQPHPDAANWPAETIQAAIASCKRQAQDIMRSHWANARAEAGACQGWLRAAAEKIDALQRELVARGLLDATDLDKVTAEPVRETVDEVPAASAQLAPATRARVRWSAAAGAWAPLDSTPPVQPVDSTPPVPAGPAPLACIRIKRAEGPLDGVEWPAGEAREFTGAEAWNAARAALEVLCESAPATGGYDKCDVCVTWANGEEYRYRFDAQHPATPGGQDDTCDIARHIVGQLHVYQGHARPLHMTPAAYADFVAAPAHAAHARALSDMLATVALPIDTTPPVREPLPPVPTVGRRVFCTGWGPGLCHGYGPGIVVDVRAPGATADDNARHILAVMVFDVVTPHDGARLTFRAVDLFDARPLVILGDTMAGDVETTAAAVRASEAAAAKATDAAIAAARFDDEVARLHAENPQLLPASARGAVGANLRAMLKAAGIRASVRKDGGDCYRVTLPHTATREALEAAKAIGARFEAGRFDGMTDSYKYRRTPWGEAFGSVHYVFTSRDWVAAPARPSPRPRARWDHAAGTWAQLAA